VSETASVDPESPQRVIKEAGPLLTGQGDLAQVGWSRHPLLDCNLEEAPDRRLQLTFTPFNERVAKTDALLLRSEVHQMKPAGSHADSRRCRRCGVGNRRGGKRASRPWP